MIEDMNEMDVLCKCAAGQVADGKISAFAAWTSGAQDRIGSNAHDLVDQLPHL